MSRWWPEVLHTGVFRLNVVLDVTGLRKEAAGSSRVTSELRPVAFQFGAVVPTVMGVGANRRRERLDLVGLTEAAEMLCISKAAICERRRRSLSGQQPVGFPKPVAELRCGPVWRRSQLERYRREREIGPDEYANERAETTRSREELLEQILMAIRPD